MQNQRPSISYMDDIVVTGEFPGIAAKFIGALRFSTEGDNLAVGDDEGNLIVSSTWHAPSFSNKTNLKRSRKQQGPGSGADCTGRVLTMQSAPSFGICAPLVLSLLAQQMVI